MLNAIEIVNDFLIMVIKIEDYGRVKNKENNEEIYLPIGHYFIADGKSKVGTISPKISIYGLGSCIALILFDSESKISGMAHILLPKARSRKKIEYPHKYANLSTKLLTKELVNLGAIKKNLKAIIIGGAKIFDLKDNLIGIDNTEAIKNDLEKLNIKIVYEEIGGSQGRVVIFDTNDLSVLIKFTHDSDFRKITKTN